MKLIYRGVAYSQSAAVPVSAPSVVAGKYRGAATTIAHPASAPVSMHRFNLKYRGVPYQATTPIAVSGGLASAF
jgi:hypothetical protein